MCFGTMMHIQDRKVSSGMKNKITEVCCSQSYVEDGDVCIKVQVLLKDFYTMQSCKQIPSCAGKIELKVASKSKNPNPPI